MTCLQQSQGFVQEFNLETEEGNNTGNICPVLERLMSTAGLMESKHIFAGHGFRGYYESLILRPVKRKFIAHRRTWGPFRKWDFYMVR